MSKETESLRDKILEESKKGSIVISTIDGYSGMNVENFIKQPADGILYDLNRLEEVCLTFIDDPKWVNDFAVAKTIRALKARIEALENLINGAVKDAVTAIAPK